MLPEKFARTIFALTLVALVSSNGTAVDAQDTHEELPRFSGASGLQEPAPWTSKLLSFSGQESEPTAESSVNVDSFAEQPSADEPQLSSADEVQATAVSHATSDLVPQFLNTSPVANPYASVPAFGQTPLKRFGYSAPFRVNIFGGENYAEPSTFFSLDVFRPIINFQDQHTESLWYVDFRNGINVDGELLANLGTGFRVYDEPTDSILDVNGWYDIDATRNRTFHQVTAGGQWQNQFLLVRGHYYLPVTETRKVVGYSDFTGESFYEGNSLLLQRDRFEDQAFEGFDAEVGIMIPYGQDYQGRIYAGYYDFQAQGAQSVTGYSATLAAVLGLGFSASAQANYDLNTNDVGYLLTATYEFYNGPRDPASNIRHRLGESVRRNRHIVSRTTALADPVAATDTNGNTLFFVHAATTGNSSGTFEDPFGSLANAATAADAVDGSIILAHADSVFTGQSIVVPEGSRFLGEGVAHTVETSQLGSLTLPNASTGTNTPSIVSSPATGPAVDLLANTELAGININNANGVGVRAQSVSDVVISNVTVDGATNGVELSGLTGAADIGNVTVRNTSATGVLVQNSTTAATVTVSQPLVVQNPGSHGVHLAQNDGSFVTQATGTVSVENAGGHGIFLDDNAATASTVFNGSTTVNGTALDGIFVSNTGTSASTTNDVDFVGDVTVQNTTGSGIQVNQNASRTGFASVNITDWNTSAIVIDNARADVTFTEALSLSNINGSAASSLVVANTDISVSFQDVSIQDNFRTTAGLPTVAFTQNGTGLDSISLTSLTVNANNGIGLFVQDVGTDVSTIEIAAGSITTTNGTAVSIEGASTDITLQSVSAANAATGILLTNVGANNAFHRQFQVIGNSSAAGSGGTINNVQVGALVSGSQDVRLNLMNIDSTVAGVRAVTNSSNQPEGLIVNGLSITDAGGSNNWVGIDMDWGNAGHLNTANQLTSNTITGSGTDQIGIRVRSNQALPEIDVAISGNTINLSGTNSDGIVVNAIGSGLVTSSIGDISLSGTLNNLVSVPGGNPFVSTTVNDGEITGTILVNGASVP